MGSPLEQPAAGIAEIALPSLDALLAELTALAPQSEAIARYLDAVRADAFTHPDGRRDPLDGMGLTEPAAALLSHLARHSPTPLSVEIGFGMGMSTSVILGTRRACGRRIQHYAFDPFGLPQNRGAVVEDYLKQQFKGRFLRVRERSEIGLGTLLKQHGRHIAGLIFIDGDHRFEHIIADFVLADLLCCPGGFIVFDDSWFPAIETAVNYIAANRPDYAVHHLPVNNLSFIQKIDTRDRRTWSAFKPFPVPQREDWTSVLDS